MAPAGIEIFSLEITIAGGILPDSRTMTGMSDFGIKTTQDGAARMTGCLKVQRTRESHVPEKFGTEVTEV